jgi:hypothetical protein
MTKINLKIKLTIHFQKIKNKIEMKGSIFYSFNIVIQFLSKKKYSNTTFFEILSSHRTSLSLSVQRQGQLSLSSHNFNYLPLHFHHTLPCSNQFSPNPLLLLFSRICFIFKCFTIHRIPHPIAESQPSINPQVRFSHFPKSKSMIH